MYSALTLRHHWIFRVVAGRNPGMSRVLCIHEPARIALALAREFADPVDAMEAGAFAAEALNRRDQLTRLEPSDS